MAGDPNEVRDLMPSLNCGGFQQKCVAVSVWLSNTPPACLDEEASIDKGGCNPDGYSIASDDQLLMTAQSGDHQAFIELCRRHSPMVKQRIFSIVRSLGTNTALMILRKRKTHKEGPTDVLYDESGAWEATEYADRSLDPERQHSRHQVILVVRREVEKLRPTLRSIIKQYYGAECSLEESAKALDISVSTAKSRLMRGRKTLRWYLKRHGVSDFRG